MTISRPSATALLLVSLAAPLAAQRSVSGTAQILKSLDRLNNTGSVLMIAAHPDDENTALLTYFARGRNFRTGYLSLTRGEGGQNLIGSEQGAKIGIIRTQELMAARRIDGAEQFFSRFIDFGFSKSATETIGKWGRDQVIGDIVWTIRRFKPDVVVLRFSGTPRDGHGQHQTSSMLAKEAFEAAGDPKRFSEQLTLTDVWKPRRLFFNLFAFQPSQEAENEKAPNTLKLDLGEYDPVLGYSFNEIAGMSRSQHRSQGMGSPERKGASRNHLQLLAGDPVTNDAFDGIDVTWKRFNAPQVGELLSRARNEFKPEEPSAIVPLLLEARKLVAARSQSTLVNWKLQELDEAIAMCAGVWAEASAERPEAIPGTKLRISANVIQRGKLPVSVDDISLPFAHQKGSALQPNQLSTIPFEWNVPADQPLSQPYWLAQPADGTRYRIPDPQLLGRPEHPPVLTASFSLRVNGEVIQLDRPVINRYVDRADGELVRPLVVVPAVAVELGEPVLMFPQGGPPRQVEVTLLGKVAKASGTVALQTPAGWKVEPASLPFSLADVNDQATLRFTLSPLSGAAGGTLRAIATMNGGRYTHGIDVIRYPHIPPQTLFPDAAAEVVPVDVKILSKKIGYVMGAGDEVPGSLRQLGCDVTLLSAEDLTRADLAQYDAIVTGVRAYNTRPDLRANYQRLMDYVAQGGTMVVQYNVADNRFFGGNQSLGTRLGPFPFATGGGRVTDEDATVETLTADPILKSPNAIGSDDWKGWVQERGLYFAREWDKQYQPLFRMKDPGEEPQDGSTLVARHGKGVYIFTGLAWFRQLPAGVPGAYRIFANFLSAAKVR